MSTMISGPGVKYPDTGSPGDPPINITASITLPFTYFGFPDGGSQNSDWTDENEAPLRLWKDVKYTGTAAALATNTNKSIYDPCPYGWQLPSYLAWSDFNFTNNATSWTGTTLQDNRGLGWYKDGYTGIRYWPGTGMAEGEIFYPAAGCIYPTTTGTTVTVLPSGVGSTAYWGGGSPNTNVTGYYTYGGQSNMYSAGYTTGRLYGLSVRCIKINAN